MTKEQFLETLKTTVLDETFLTALTKEYELSFQNEAAKLLSMTSNKPVFIGEEQRLLTREEFQTFVSSESSHRLLPLIDCWDGNWIALTMDSGCWTKYNEYDGICYGKEVDSLEYIL